MPNDRNSIAKDMINLIATIASRTTPIMPIIATIGGMPYCMMLMSFMWISMFFCWHDSIEHRYYTSYLIHPMVTRLRWHAESHGKHIRRMRPYVSRRRLRTSRDD